MREYFTNIYEAVTTIGKGMGVTMKAFLTRPETVQYPEIDVLDPEMPGYKGNLGPVQERFRGIIEVAPNSCTVCRMCERSCPIDCIQVEDVRGTKTRAPNLKPGGKEMPKARHLTRFDIHIGRCMYCGLCVEACPTGAIHFSRKFEAASADYAKMTRSYITGDYKKQSLKSEAEETERKATEEAKKVTEEKKEENTKEESDS